MVGGFARVGGAMSVALLVCGDVSLVVHAGPAGRFVLAGKVPVAGDIGRSGTFALTGVLAVIGEVGAVDGPADPRWFASVEGIVAHGLGGGGSLITDIRSIHRVLSIAGISLLADNHRILGNRVIDERLLDDTARCIDSDRGPVARWFLVAGLRRAIGGDRRLDDGGRRLQRRHGVRCRVPDDLSDEILEQSIG